MWQKPSDELPEEEALVVVQVRGEVRENYYRIEGRWYDISDLNRWRMSESSRWSADRTWYIKTKNIEAWHYQKLNEERKKKKGKGKLKRKRERKPGRF